MSKGITTEKIYDLINEVRRELRSDLEGARVELKKDIGAVDGKVDNLSGQLGQVKVAQAVNTTKIYMIVGLISLVITTVFTAIVNNAIGMLRGR